MRQPVYTVAEVARLYKWSRNTVYKHINGGLLPCLNPGQKGGSIRIRESDLQEFERRLCQGHDTSDPATGSSPTGTDTGNSAGRKIVELDPFQRGREIAQKRKGS